MKNFNDWEKRGKHGAGQPYKKNFEKRDFRGPGFDRPKFQAICADCGKRCEVPFNPSGGRPVYCNDCFHKDEHQGGEKRFQPGRDSGVKRFEAPSRPQDNRSDFDQLNRKLDTIIELLKVVKAHPVKEVPLPVITKPAEAEKAKKPAKKKIAKTDKKKKK